MKILDFYTNLRLDVRYKVYQEIHNGNVWHKVLDNVFFDVDSTINNLTLPICWVLHDNIN